MSRRLNQILITLTLVFLLGIGILFGISAQAEAKYGPPNSTLNTRNQLEYAARLLLYGDRPIRPLDPDGLERIFNIETGEAVASIALRMEENGLINREIEFMEKGQKKTIQYAEIGKEEL